MLKESEHAAAAAQTGQAGQAGLPHESSERHAHAPALRLPYTLGRYTLFDFIGRGGMAQIYLARTNSDLGASRLCVLKLILPEYAGHAQFADMLTHEAKLAAQLGHANIVHVFELGRIEGRLFIAMEYIEGFDLNALLRRCSRQKVPLPMEFALYIIICVLRGLDYAHRRADDTGRPLGVVHRDVSPSNLLISFDGEVKVCDFGIAHANDVVAPVAAGASGPDAVPGHGESPLVDEAIKGKAGYMSPEHARGVILDARADVFATGIVLWELLAGRRLYRHAGPSPTRAALLDLARKAEIPPLPTRSLPREPELHAIVARALAVDKNNRYPSAAAMLRELEAYAIETGRMPNPLKLGVWLSAHFGNEVIAHRRMRERAAAALTRAAEARELDALLTPIPPSPSGPPVSSFPVARSLPALPQKDLETITVPPLPPLPSKLASVPPPSSDGVTVVDSLPPNTDMPLAVPVALAASTASGAPVPPEVPVPLQVPDASLPAVVPVVSLAQAKAENAAAAGVSVAATRANRILLIVLLLMLAAVGIIVLRGGLIDSI